MKGTNLGEFEELVLLVVANLYDEAYGINIRDAIVERCGRSVSLSTVHAALHRLQNKGYLNSAFDKTSISTRGGRPKLNFWVSSQGRSALERARTQRNNLWSTIPPVFFDDPSQT